MIHGILAFGAVGLIVAGMQTFVHNAGGNGAMREPADRFAAQVVEWSGEPSLTNVWGEVDGLTNELRVGLPRRRR